MVPQCHTDDSFFYTIDPPKVIERIQGQSMDQGMGEIIVG